MTEQTYTQTVDISYDSTPVVVSRTKRRAKRRRRLRRTSSVRVTRVSKSQSLNNQVNIMNFYMVSLIM